MNKAKPKPFTRSKKIICDWSDKKNFSKQYRTLKFYVRLSTLVENVHTMVFFREKPWLKPYVVFQT